MEGKEKTLCSLIVLGLLFCCSTVVTNAQTSEQIAEKALGSTVLLEMKNARGTTIGLGSGFFVRDGHIATNYHVIKGAAGGTAKLVGKQTRFDIEG